MYTIVKLVFNGEIVGYRAINGEKYDVELGVIHDLKINLSHIKQAVELFEHGDLLMTKAEIKSGKPARDISNDISLVQKVFNKNYVPRKTIPFSKGLAIALIEREYESSEYDYSSQSNVLLIFENAKIVQDVVDIVGSRLNKHNTISSISGGKKAYNVKLEDHQLYTLRDKFGCSELIAKDGFTLSSMNFHSDNRFGVQLVPPNFDVDFSGDLRYARVGSTADGDSLEQYVEIIKSSLQNGYMTYLPDMTLREISRL